MTRIVQQIVTIAQIVSAFAITVSAVPAQAQNRETRRIEVNYSDLNLTTATGRKALDRRIHFAARDACGGEPTIVDLAAVAGYHKCYTSAVGGATTQLAAKTGAILAAR